MAKRRTLKKNIHIICETLFAECVAASLYSETADDDTVASLLMSVVSLQHNAISRISHKQPEMPAKVYFKDMKEQFNAQVDEICDNINALG